MNMTVSTKDLSQLPGITLYQCILLEAMDGRPDIPEKALYRTYEDLKMLMWEAHWPNLVVRPVHRTRLKYKLGRAFFLATLQQFVEMGYVAAAPLEKDATQTGYTLLGTGRAVMQRYRHQERQQQLKDLRPLEEMETLAFVTLQELERDPKLWRGPSSEDICDRFEQVLGVPANSMPDWKILRHFYALERMGLLERKIHPVDYRKRLWNTTGLHEERWVAAA